MEVTLRLNTARRADRQLDALDHALSIVEAYPEHPVFAAYAQLASLGDTLPGVSVTLTPQSVADLLASANGVGALSAEVTARGKCFRAQLYELNDHPRISLRSDSADFADFEASPAHIGFLADFLSGPSARPPTAFSVMAQTSRLRQAGP